MKTKAVALSLVAVLIAVLWLGGVWVFNLSQQVEADARNTLSGLVYRTVIPRNVRLSEAPSHAMPVLQYDTNSKGSAAYRELAKEFLSRQSVAA